MEPLSIISPPLCYKASKIYQEKNHLQFTLLLIIMVSLKEAFVGSNSANGGLFWTLPSSMEYIG